MNSYATHSLAFYLHLLLVRVLIAKLQINSEHAQSLLIKMKTKIYSSYRDGSAKDVRTRL